jgi:phosphomethylpyrimidine synthase
MTILEEVSKGSSTSEIKFIAKKERIEEKLLIKKISKGQIVIMKNNEKSPLGIGNPLKTKINVNLGTSSSIIDIEEEMEKLQIVHKYGADTISDLSMGGNIDEIRKFIVKNSNLLITSVPIYQATIKAEKKGNISEDLIFKTIENQIEDGISSIVIHAGFTLEDLNKLKGRRIMGMVSKGGCLTASIMSYKSIENPFLKNFEYILDLIKERDVVINLGNAMRSGCIHDKVDDFHINEMKLNAKLAKIANQKGIQVIIESLGGHIIVNQLLKWIKKQKSLTKNRPLFVAGPLPIDKGVGYDHISAAIGGAFAAGFGADYLCSITPSEHLKLPSPQDIKEGLISCKLAAHVGDSMKYGLNHLFNDDLALSKNRLKKNWKEQIRFCIDPEEFSKKHPTYQKECTMCGKYCALDFSRKCFK